MCTHIGGSPLDLPQRGRKDADYGPSLVLAPYTANQAARRLEWAITAVFAGMFPNHHRFCPGKRGIRYSRSRREDKEDESSGG
jgi:hypothetical protein